MAKHLLNVGPGMLAPHSLDPTWSGPGTLAPRGSGLCPLSRRWLTWQTRVAAQVEDGVTLGFHRELARPAW